VDEPADRGSYYPYSYVVEHPTATVRVEGVPKQVEVFVDGYFAGTGGKVRTTPGGHAITLYLPGYRTVTENIYVAPGSTYKMREAMDRLAAGEASALPPAPQPSDAGPRGHT
jgi:PEGA domain